MEQKQRVIVYIDGFNFYFGLKSNAKWKKYYWLDIVKLFEMFMRPNQELVAVKYFSAKPDDIDQSLRQNAFFQANRENPKFKLILGKYLKKSITCFKCGNVIHTHEEKETDVRIATQIVADAYQKNCDISIVVSADSDMIPAIELATEACQKVFVYFPPYQYSSNLATMGMGKPIHMKQYETRFRQCLLPDVVHLGKANFDLRYLRNGRLFSQSESEIRVIKRKIRNTVWNIQSYYGFFFSSMIFLFVLQEVLQFGVGLYALQLVSDNLPDLGTDTVVVILVHLLHAVVAAGICKVRDDGYRPVSLFLTLHFLGIDHNWMINGLI